MPFSILLQGYPTDNVPAPHVQGATVQGMFLHLLEEVDPAVARRLHDESKYRPYTLSPLGIGEPSRQFDGFRLPRQYDLQAGTPCYLRVCLLEDGLFPPFSRYFLERPEPSFRLGGSEFTVTNVTVTQDGGSPWSLYLPYEQLIERALPQPAQGDAAVPDADELPAGQGGLFAAGPAFALSQFSRAL